MTDPLNILTVMDLRKGMQERAFTALEVIDACLQRIASRDPLVKAWIAVDAEGARDAARHPRGDGPLKGIPFAAKDVFRTARLSTGMGSAIYSGADNRFDAAAVGWLRGAGAIMLGKTATAEFAGTAPPETRHPLAPTHTPGGSSSGSAAAVADHMVPFALGTQTGGSVIRPAAFCGIVGFKPTFGLYPVDGMKMAAQSFDTVGLFTRTTEDAALLHSVFMRDEPTDPAGPFRIGVLRTHLDDTLQPAASAAIEGAIARLVLAGCTATALDAPDWLKGLTGHRAVINGFERHRALSPEAIEHLEEFRPESRATWQAGRDITGDAYSAARRAVDQARAATIGLFDDFDLLVTPATPGEAPEGLQSTGDPRLQELWTVLHLPTLCLPVGSGPAGLPLSMQMIAPPYQDARLLSAAAWAERKLGPASTQRQG